jgi:hypothetical protein
MELIDTRLERSRIVAPFDGIVIHGDLTQSLGALTGRSFGFVVERITPAASARDGRNFFEVVARLDAHQAALQPGLRGVARIGVGERSLAWIWTHGLLDRLRLSLWSWGL